MTVDGDKVQETVIDEMKKVYSETVIDHAMNPRNLGILDMADGYGIITGSCGDTMKIWLRIKDNTIIEATFMTDGCGATIAAGSRATELAKGKNVSQTLRINQHNILSALNGLPEGNRHCALLAANTLKEAIKDYINLKKEPWKRNYPRR
jgi:nitrogen fixation NifU-like protein